MSTAADICRERGWGKDTLIVDRLGRDDDWEDIAFRITAVGEKTILALPLGGRSSECPEWRAYCDMPDAYFDEYALDSFRDAHAIPHLPWEKPDLGPQRGPASVAQIEAQVKRAKKDLEAI